MLQKLKLTGNLFDPMRCVTLYVTVHDKKDYLRAETVWFAVWEGRVIASHSRFGEPEQYHTYFSHHAEFA